MPPLTGQGPQTPSGSNAAQHPGRIPAATRQQPHPVRTRTPCRLPTAACWMCCALCCCAVVARAPHKGCCLDHRHHHHWSGSPILCCLVAPVQGRRQLDLEGTRAGAAAARQLCSRWQRFFYPAHAAAGDAALTTAAALSEVLPAATAEVAAAGPGQVA